jgi:3-deoxy-D-manno-octulosonic-acid transferase
MLIYHFLTFIYYSLIRIGAFFHTKARRWTDGRRHVFQQLEAAFADRKPGLWMHCASLGEFEQGRTLLEAFRREKPGLKILLTFFSPSGYEMRKNTPLADVVTYLPADTPANVRRFLDCVNPQLVIFVKYEFWFGYLLELKRRHIPLFLIAAILRKNQPFFQGYGSLHRRMLSCFTRIYVQNEESVKLLATATKTPVTLAGDPRIDRVLEIAAQDKTFPLIRQFCGSSPVLVAGSTWLEDEKLLQQVFSTRHLKGWKLIIAPHEVNAAHVEVLRERFAGHCLLYAELEKNPSVPFPPVLIIDRIGLLAWLYRYGRIAYIGGGFGNGIHNTLEPLAFGLPVIFGPRYQKFEEAHVLIRNGGGFSIHNPSGFLRVFDQLQDPVNYQHATQAAFNYLTINKGATDRIVKDLMDVV